VYSKKQTLNYSYISYIQVLKAKGCEVCNLLGLTLGSLQVVPNVSVENIASVFRLHVGNYLQDCKLHFAEDQSHDFHRPENLSFHEGCELAHTHFV
jgi:hypothetical protein